MNNNSSHNSHIADMSTLTKAVQNALTTYSPITRQSYITTSSTNVSFPIVQHQAPSNDVALNDCGFLQPQNSTQHIFGGKKPHEFSHGDNIHDFLLAFENYCTVINLPRAAMFRVFCTFLDNKSQVRVRSLKLTDASNWTTVKELIIQTLDPNYNCSTSDELFKAQQNSYESVRDFSERLEKIANSNFTLKKFCKSHREILLKEAFISGLDSKQIEYSLLTTPGIDTFEKAVQHSLKLEQITKKLRAKTNRGEAIAKDFALLNIQETPKQTPRCWTCNKVGHIRRECRQRRFCRYCKMRNHFTHDCLKMKRANKKKENKHKPNQKRRGRKEKDRLKKEMKSNVTLVSQQQI